MVSLLKLLIASYNYLGLLLQHNGTFNNTQKQLAIQGRKATFSLKSKTSQLFLNFIQKRYCLYLIRMYPVYLTTVVKYGAAIMSTISKSYIKRILSLYSAKGKYKYGNGLVWSGKTVYESCKIVKNCLILISTITQREFILKML